MSGPANTQFAIATHLLTLLAGCPDSSLSSEAMSRSTGSNPVHARRVLGELRRAGLVRSRPGPRGGWQLARDPASISLDEVWTAVRGEAPLLGLHDADPSCETGQRIHSELEALDRRTAAVVRDELARVSVDDLLASVGVATLAPAGEAPAA